MTSVSCYSSFINKSYNCGIISIEKEYELVIKAQDGCEKSAYELVMAYMKLVIHYAKEFRGYNLPEEDLVQSGSIGLLKAIKTFSTSFGVRFSTYAAPKIKGEICEFVIRNWSIVKVATTKAHRKLFFNLRSITRKDLNNLSSKDIGEISSKLGVTNEDVIEMQKRLRYNNFDYIDDESDDNGLYTIKDKSPNQEKLLELSQESNLLFNAINKLDERSKYIISKRFLCDEDDKPTYQVIGDKLNISQQRVKQIEISAINKLKYWVNNEK